MLRRLLGGLGRLILGAALLLIALGLALVAVAGYLVYLPYAALPPRKRGLKLLVTAGEVAAVFWQMRHEFDGEGEGVEPVAGADFQAGSG